MLKNMKIQTRILASFMTIIVLSTALIYMLIYALGNSNSIFGQFVDNQYAAATTVKDTRININSMSRMIRDALLADDIVDFNTHKNEFYQSEAEARSNMEELKKYDFIDDKIINEYIEEINIWITTAHLILKEGETGNREKAIAMVETECTPQLQALLTMVGNIDEKMGQNVSDQISKNMLMTNVYNFIGIVILVFLIIFSIVLSIRITKSIVKPLIEIEDAANEMANGNLRSIIKYESKDAVGQVAHAMRISINTLHLYINDISRAMEKMAGGDFNVRPSQPFIGDFKNIENSISKFILKMSEILSHVQRSAEEVSSSSAQVASTAQNISHGSSEQASSVEILSNSIDEIMIKIEENTQNSKLVNDMAHNTSTAMNNSNEQMQKLMYAMKDIDNKSVEISKIVKTIEDIAFQTNILALNAAVEAARAGEAGKGFAVVADEVRNLAIKSSEAAKNTTTLIQSTTASVGIGVKYANETAHELSTVVGSIESTTIFIDKLNKATTEQEVLLREVSNSIKEISSVVQANSSSSEESAAISEELYAQSEIMKNLIAQFNVYKEINV